MEGYVVYFETDNIFYKFDKKKNFSTGFDFTYCPPSVSGELAYNYKRAYLNAFVKMLFLKKQLSVTLKGNNLLKEYDYNVKRERSGNLTFGQGYYSSLSVRLSVSYNFGSQNINVQRRQAGNEDEKEKERL